jgi:uncharacterized protein (TIGR03437 family)
MLVHWKTALATALCAAAFSPICLAQEAPPVILTVDVENVVQYIDDNTDFTKLATVPGPTVGSASQNFRKFVILGDIVGVNGKPVKGTLVENSRAITMRPSPSPGQAITDITRNNVTQFAYEFLAVDGSPIGTIVGIGFGNGPPPPGAPQALTQGNQPITGGSGAFLGVHGIKGQSTAVALTSTQRVASMVEDPANRRVNGGATQKFIFYIIPVTRPAIVVESGAPAIYHEDFSPVTTAKPAKAGQVLIVKATGLGPTVPGVDPGQPFPTDASQLVNSPVDVTIGGQPAEVINKVGWPGLVDTYRVDFRVPSGIAAGMTAVQLAAAWIGGSPVNIPIQ